MKEIVILGDFRYFREKNDWLQSQPDRVGFEDLLNNGIFVENRQNPKYDNQKQMVFIYLHKKSKKIFVIPFVELQDENTGEKYYFLITLHPDRGLTTKYQRMYPDLFL